MFPHPDPTLRTYTRVDSGVAYGGARDEVFYLEKSGQYKTTQIHAYGGEGDDTMFVDVAVPVVGVDFVQGHHLFSGPGQDNIVFQVDSSQSGRIVSRLDDFDPMRDTLWVARDGAEPIAIDPYNPPDGVQFVLYRDQVAMIIDGKSLIVLEGARMKTSLVNQDMTDPRPTEKHFPEWPLELEMASVTFRSSENFIPFGGRVEDLPILRTQSVEEEAHHEEEHDPEMDMSLVVVETHGTDGAEYITSIASRQKDRVLAGVGNDAIDGGKDHDTIYGGAGNDAIAGGSDMDKLWGDSGNDTLWGGTENDSLYGGNGHDVLHGGDGVDNLEGGSGNDTLYGGWGIDALLGGVGADRLWGGSGNDRLSGGGNDTLYGGNGHDQLRGEAGVDAIYAGSGSDTLWGSGSDTLDGGDGNDVLNVGTGGGHLGLVGGSGVDRYVFQSGFGTATVVWGEGDVLDVRAFGQDAWEAASFTQEAGAVRVEFATGDVLFMAGTSLVDAQDWSVLG